MLHSSENHCGIVVRFVTALMFQMSHEFRLLPWRLPCMSFKCNASVRLAAFPAVVVVKSAGTVTGGGH